MCHDGFAHIQHEFDVLIAESLSRLVPQDTICANSQTIRSCYRHARVESCLDTVDYVRTVAESHVIREIVDYMDLISIFVISVGALVRARDVDGVLNTG